MAHSYPTTPSTMKEMTRPLKPSPEKFPKHVVHSDSMKFDRGITFSVETKQDSEDAQAEYEVIKAILNREGYLNRLRQVARTVGKKFKNEVADIIDFVRASTLDVIDTIIRWRIVKKDHDAAFMWNGVNYILKMPSDLDYLADYLAIKKWMGFTLTRNPFCVPYPLDEGKEVLNNATTNPKHIESGKLTDGFMIGGIKKSTLKKKYLPTMLQTREDQELKSLSTAPAITQSGAATVSGVSTQENNSHYSQKSSSHGRISEVLTSGPIPKAFILNEDMAKIRQAEIVILTEEKKFGALSKDPHGRIMPILQAMTNHASLQLRKDNQRPLTEQSLSSAAYAPHAYKSDVGIADQPWTPDVTSNDSKAQMDNAAIGSSNLFSSTLGKDFKYSEQLDDSLLATTRGAGKSGGALAPLQSKGATTRNRRPLKTTLAGEMEFQRIRKIRTLSEKMEEINALKAEIESERKRISTSASSRGLTSTEQMKLAAGGSEWQQASPDDNGSFSEEHKKYLIKRNISNHTFGDKDRSTSKDKLFSKTVAADSRNSEDESSMKKSRRTSMSDRIASDDLKSRTVIEEEELSSTSTSKRKMGMAEDKVDIKEARRRSVADGSGGGYGDGGASTKSLRKSMSEGGLVSKMRKKSVDSESGDGAVSVLVQKLDQDALQLQRQVHHYEMENVKTLAVKAAERASKNKELSRDIERKRRLLTKEEGVRVGPPQQDDANMYDYYAIRLQATIRGWLARCWIKWFKKMSTKAAIKVQSTIRGWLGRLRVRRIRNRDRAATLIQKNFRGWLTRGTSAAMAKQKNFQRSAVTIQRVWRGVLGARRAESKKALDAAARAAFESVDDVVVSADDVKELATRIIYAIEEPLTTSFPPDEVLHLIRLAVMCINAARGAMGIAEYDFFNARSYDEHDGSNLTWLDAAKIVNRSQRFMRLLRMMAYGPGAKPPRLIQLPNDVNLLYTAQTSNPKFVLKTFETMGMGSKICIQLFKWMTSIIEVAQRQQEFLSLIASSFPDWVPKLIKLQASLRYHEFETIINKKCSELLSLVLEQASEDGILAEALETQMNYAKRDIQDAKSSIRGILNEVDMLKDDQSAREVFALVALTKKVDAVHEELDELILTYQQTVQLAAQGDRQAQEALSDLRHRLTNTRLRTSEIDAQKKVLEIQVEANRAKRKDDARLTPAIIHFAQLAGEVKAQYANAKAKTQALLHSNGVKTSQKLPLYLLDIYEELQTEEDRLKAIARKAYVEADEMRVAYDTTLSRIVTANEVKELKAKDQMVPSEIELQQDRLEDERLAMEERKKHRQYLPDSVYVPAPTRSRPVIIGLSRDLSKITKQKIHDEVTKLMPGLFVYLSEEKNMGINQEAIQAVFDSRRSVIMDVDPGLTRLTRDTFLKALEISYEGLIPKPFFALAMGDEGNRSGSAYHGVDKLDLQNVLRDGQIKSNLETMSYIISLIETVDIHKKIQDRANDLVPRSKPFAIVVEALFVVLSDKVAYHIPDTTVSATSWRVTRPLLTEPRHIVQKMRNLRRGSASVHAVECLQCYLKHPHWPIAFTDERSSDQVLNLFALFIESYVSSEKLCQAGGGVPLQALTKSSMRGIQTVVCVRDTFEKPEEVDLLRTDSWKMGTYRLLRTALQDMRVLKCGMKIDGELYTVSVYRECGNVFFEVYDSSSSDIYMAVVSVDELPFLLIPNAHARESGINVDPPQTPQEMYLALSKLLRFEVRGIKFKEKVLVCRRQYTFITNVTRKINGHMMMIKCFEAALSELFFTAYIPEHCAYITCLVDANARLAMQRNADTGGSLESEHVLKEDARPLLPYMLDRLRISPSKPMYFARGLEMTTTSSTSGGNGLAPGAALKSQGFVLKSRVHGGVGRILMRRIWSFYKVIHLVEVRISSVTQLMDLIVYEPIQQHTMKLRLSRFKRLVLLGSVTDDYLSWYPELKRRLRLNWHGKHSIHFDMTLFNAIRKVAGCRVKISFSVADEDNNSIIVSAFFFSNSKVLEGTLTKEDVIKLLLYENPAKQLQREHNKKSAYDPVVYDILKDMQTVLPTPDIEINAINYPEVFSKPLEYFIMDRSRLGRVADHLSSLLRPLKADDPSLGCASREYPLFMKMLPGASSSSSSSDSIAVAGDAITHTAAEDQYQFDFTLRRRTFLQISLHRGDYNSVVRTRRQAAPINLEEELNIMAMEKSREADLRVQSDAVAAIAVQEHLALLPSDAAVQSAIAEATQSVADDLLSSIQSSLTDRFRERNNPGTFQIEFERSKEEEHQRQVALMEEERRNKKPDSEEDRMITSEDWMLVFEAGVKTNYKDGRVRWHGHVGVKVFETNCWTENEGTGKRYKFIVYEPNSAQSFEGLIRSRKHLKEILGRHGKDLADHNKLRETLLFICRYRLDVVVNKLSWDGVENPSDAPAYRIEFQSDRMYSEDKVTPINAGTEDDEAANKIKFMSVDNARGKKIIRMVRRVNGLLLQLVVFELPAQVAEAAYSRTKAQLLHSAEALILHNNAAAAAAANATAQAGTGMDSSQQLLVVSDGQHTDESQYKKFAEDRISTLILEKYDPPAFRIVAYDVQSKRKATLGVEPQAVIEVSGGIYSPFLNPSRRKELARVVCDSLIVLFPSSRPYEIVVPWSGAKKEISTATAPTKGSKASTKSGAERVLNRPGRLFRSAMRICQYELLVSVYSHVISEVANTEDNHDNRQLIFNFYSPAVSDAVEVCVSETGQIERLGVAVMKLTEGAQRAIGIRRLCRWFRAEIIEDILDSTKKTLYVVLLPPSKGFLSDYQEVSVPGPGEFVRPVGVPGVFFPLDTCGRPLHRVGMTLQNRQRTQPDRDFLITVYTKSMAENPERGLVIKLYDRSVCETSILHVGASELIRLCNAADEPDLLRDMVYAKNEEDGLHLDEIESGFSQLTLKGEMERATKLLVDKLVVDVMLTQLGFYISPQDSVVPYIKNAPRGIFPA